MTIARFNLVSAGAAIMTLVLARAVIADTVTLRGSTIPLQSCVVQDLKLGRLYFRDGGSRRRHREIDEVVALGFTGLPALDEAERLLATDDVESGLARMLEALVAAESEVQRVWIHMRLSQVHDRRGELVPAASHAAAVFLLRDEAYWQRLAPESTGTDASFPAVAEALGRVRAASASVRNRSLQRILGRLSATLTPVHETLAATYDGAPVAPGTTESGYPIESIRAGVVLPERPADAEPPISLETVAAGERLPERRDPLWVAGPEVESTARREPNSSPRSSGTRDERTDEHRLQESQADEIDAALVEGRAAAALAQCERIAENPGKRDLGRFMHQYGRALLAVGRAKDASVMFLRVAVHYESSPFAAPSLVEAAEICRDAFGNPAAAARLARRAIEFASDRGDTPTADRARGFLATLNSGKDR